MYSIIEFNDYRKEVQIECVGYCSDWEKTKQALFRRVVEEYSKRSNSAAYTYVVLEKVDQTEYVYLDHKKKWQYRAVVIRATSPVTIGKFSKMFLTTKKNRSNDSPLTQEWIMENMDEICSKFYLYEEYEEEDDEDEEEDDDHKNDKKDNKDKKEKTRKPEAVRYSTIYAIVEINEIV